APRVRLGHEQEPASPCPRRRDHRVRRPAAARHRPREPQRCQRRQPCGRLPDRAGRPGGRERGLRARLAGRLPQEERPAAL
ncbi:MAG: hypothetical protein AVDCRST_MAG16-722, partial [uncultured Frankineae bacterium]